MAVNPELLYPPIELAHVAGLLESEGHEVVIVDGDALGVDAAGALERIRAMAPDVCVLDSSSTSLDQDLELAGRVREVTGALTGMLGSQVTFTPDEIFEGGRIDFVVRGEPEYTVLAVVQSRAAGGELNGLAGVTWKGADGQVVHEAEREKIKNLDDLPLPARHLLDNGAYHFPGINGPITTVKSSRGCPLNCSFCGYTLAQGLRFRFRSPEHVLAELKDLYFVHGLRDVIFRDPIFTTRKDRIVDICDGILALGMSDLSWQCETAVKTLDAELLGKMAAAGCTHVSLGIESGNAEIQKKHCGNKLSDLDKAAEVFRAARQVGIETRAFCMIGFPEETPTMADETIALVDRLDPDQVQFCAVTAYPGTPLHTMLRDSRDFDYAAMTGFQALEGNEHMTADEIQDKIREGYRRFYRRPKRMLRELKDPKRFAARIARYATLFKRRAAV